MSAALVRRAYGETLESLASNAEIFCAVSGGIDSMVLLHCAALHFAGGGAKAVVLHVNHGLRGKESDLDEAFVRGEATKRKLPFLSRKLSWKTERPTQATCREKRFAFFEECLGEHGKILLAHHQGDQAETLLLRLMRGTGLRGLRGMAPVNGQKVRPFLGISRAQIEAAAKEWKLEWREDSSNANSKYERNWLRHELMPLIEARRPGASERIASLAAQAREISLPTPTPDFFTLPEGSRFFRAKELCQFTNSEISHFFRLSRLHTKGLRALLQKGTGHYSGGTAFGLSAGILVASATKFSPPPAKKNVRGETIKLSTLLGEWTVRPNRGEQLGFQRELNLGDHVKKEFQREKVPVFFREQLPLLLQEGKASALLPGKVSRLPGVSATFSPLANWWLPHSMRNDR